MAVLSCKSVSSHFDRPIGLWFASGSSLLGQQAPPVAAVVVVSRKSALSALIFWGLPVCWARCDLLYSIHSHDLGDNPGILREANFSRATNLSK